MQDYNCRFEQINSIPDEVERSWAIEDLCYEAECLFADGNTADAIEIFKWIYNVPPDDDLTAVAYLTARKALITAKVVILPPLSEIIESLELEFSALAPRARLLAIAKTIHRSHLDDYPEATNCIFQLIDQAHQMSPLNINELKFKSTVLANLS